MQNSSSMAHQAACGREVVGTPVPATRVVLGGAKPRSGAHPTVKPARVVLTKVSAPNAAESVSSNSTGEKPPFTAWDTAKSRVAKRTDIKSILVLGAGPIVIGQVRDQLWVGLRTHPDALRWRVVLGGSRETLTRPELSGTGLGPPGFQLGRRCQPRTRRTDPSTSPTLGAGLRV